MTQENDKCGCLWAVPGAKHTAVVMEQGRT